MSETNISAEEIPPVRGSVTNWISQVREGRSTAAGALWQRYEKRLLALASKRLLGKGVIIADEADVVNDAIGAFLMRIREGAFHDLEDRNGLWKLLATITINRANSLVRDENRGKRSIAHTIHDSSLSQPLDESLAAAQQPPDATVLFAETFGEFLSLLGDGELEEIALAKMEGASNDEIARKIDRSIPTVERRLRLIRRKLQQAIDA